MEHSALRVDNGSTIERDEIPIKMVNSWKTKVSLKLKSLCAAFVKGVILIKDNQAKRKWIGIYSTDFVPIRDN